MPLLPVVTWLFAALSLLWFGLAGAALFGAITQSSAPDTAHALYGYGVLTIEFAAVLGWAWAITRGVRHTIVSRPSYIMSAATVVADLAIVSATVTTIGGWPQARLNPYLYHAGLAALLFVALKRSRRSKLIHASRRNSP